MRAFTSRSGCLLAAARRSGGWQCTDNEVKARLSTSALKHGVSHTALVVAAIRAREKRLFFDPYARLLCGDEGEQLLEEFLSMPKDNFFLTAEKQREMFKLGVAIRHNFFDEFIISALQVHRKLGGGGEVPLQFVNVASGLDSRAYRLGWPPNVSMFEIDRPEVVAFKRSRIEPTGAKPICKHHAIVEADVVTDDWEAALVQKGFDRSRPCVWLCEGLLSYLPEAEVTRLLQRMRAMSVPSSRFGGDWTTTDLLSSSVTKELMAKLADLKAPMLSGSNKPERSLQAGGWEEPLVAFLGDERASYDLWPTKPKPRWWPSLLPRVWLMTATARAARE